MKRKTLITLILVCIFLPALASCSPSEEAISAAIVETMEAWTPIPTFTSQPSYTPAPAIAVEVTREVTRIVEVTPTFTSTPRFTATVTFTPTITNTPTRTPTVTNTPNATQTSIARETERLRQNRGNGFYLVNIDIAPGVWRSTGTGDSCYWATTTSTGSILSNHFGMSGGTAYISPSAYQVEFSDCGNWTFLSPP